MGAACGVPEPAVQGPALPSFWWWLAQWRLYRGKQKISQAQTETRTGGCGFTLVVRHAPPALDLGPDDGQVLIPRTLNLTLWRAVEYSQTFSDIFNSVDRLWNMHFAMQLASGYFGVLGHPQSGPGTAPAPAADFSPA
jgi:hypothetical protein